MTDPIQKQENGFAALGISGKILKILIQSGFNVPTPIQHQSIPPAIAGKDIMGIAQTGTGKTLAYGIPVLERLLKNEGRALIVSPTRELALQVEASLKVIAQPLGIKTTVLIGGESFHKQKVSFNSKPRLIVVTPGRMIDHLKQGTVKLHDIFTLVLDEADRMLDMGFAPQINEILKKVPRERQTLLYSATMPDGIVKLATSYMKLPVRVEVAPAGTTAESIEQEIILVRNEAKMPLIESILGETTCTALVFSRTKSGAKRICRSLNVAGHKTAEIHANRTQSQRKEALDGFRNGKYRVLVATDIAARGIDVSHIELVINFDLPDNSEDYIHRIGRTGRAGRSGKAISFATPSQKGNIREIERLIRKSIKVSATKIAPVPGSNPRFDDSADERPRRGFDSRRSRPSGPRSSAGGRSSGPRSSSDGRPSGPRSSSGGRPSSNAPRARRDDAGAPKTAGDPNKRYFAQGADKNKGPKAPGPWRGRRRPGDGNKPTGGGKPGGPKPSGNRY